MSNTEKANGREFLSDVYNRVLEKDEATLIESDDLLQDDFIYGGLVEGGEGYGFT